MRTIFDRLLSTLSSLRLTVVLLLFLALLTWLGTLEQVHAGLYEAQRKYFDSLVLVHRAGAIPVPLPGAMLVMIVLAVNLFLGGMLRLRKGIATAGVLVTHVGIAMMLAAGLVKTRFAEDGHVTLFEGQRANEFQSYVLWELAVTEEAGDGRWRERVAPEGAFRGASAEPVRISPTALPFDLELRHFQPNARVLPKGPMFTPELPVVDGFFLEPLPVDPQAEANVAGLYLSVIDRASGARQEGISWGAEAQPWTVSIAGRRFALALRHERYAMPFTLELVDFTKEDHPRLDMPKAFSSDVRVIEGPSSRPVKISMNEPLRSGGLVVYQASWGPSDARPGTPLFSTLAVVSNPADQYPLYSCIVSPPVW